MIIVYICCRSFFASAGFCFGRLPLVFEFAHTLHLPRTPFDVYTHLAFINSFAQK